MSASHVAPQSFDDMLRDVQADVLSRHPEWVRGLAAMYRKRPALALAKAKRVAAGIKKSNVKLKAMNKRRRKAKP